MVSEIREVKEMKVRTQNTRPKKKGKQARKIPARDQYNVRKYMIKKRGKQTMVRTRTRGQKPRELVQVRTKGNELRFKSGRAK